MAALDDLLARIDDVSLRAAIEQELAPLRGDRELGLVFERHLPEKVRLPGLPVRRGTTVEIRADQKSPTWQVVRVSDGAAELRRRGDDGTTITETRPAEDLVVVREFGQPIYPGLRSVGRIERGGDDKPFHTVFNSENYHALETLLYTCEGKADVIYIDPPYNTGARDWKYNNDYVDGNDTYRNSKWLSFMEKRLLLAKRLLNPAGSVLIVTIDEKEYLRLGLLLQQVFPGTKTQMVSITINPKGTARPNEFSRVDEYAFIVLLGASVVPDVRAPGGAAGAKVRWRYLRRTDDESVRGSRPRQFYPVYVNTVTGTVENIGEPLSPDVDRSSAPHIDGCVAVFPVREDGVEMEWGLTGPSLRSALNAGFVRVTPGYELQPYILAYLTAPNIKKIERGELVVTGRRPDGSKEVVAPLGKTSRPTTVWRETAHDAGAHGTSLIGALVPGRKFPFPKSLYAVEDTLRLFVGDKPEALILDFFGGSGTTTHAVMRLNHQDGGLRRSILVTNNEIGPDAEKLLTRQGLAAGHPEWEALGIFEHITKPRIEAAATGVTHEGNPVVGDYKFTDVFPMSDGLAENVEFFTLTYEDPDRVQLGVAFETIAPLLWLMAGAAGPRIDTITGPWSIPEGGRYGVLFDADAWPSFTEAVKDRDGLTHVFVATDSDAVFQRVVAELPDTVTPVRLYESYLRSFAINTGA